MRLELDLALADGYSSAAQRIRRVSEGWFGRHMFCPACPSDRLCQTPGNTEVVDFFCDSCGAEYQLKAKGGPLGRRIRDAAYRPMMERILADRAPHFAFLNYTQVDWQVRNLLLIPRHFFTPAVIVKGKPLSPQARRHGWVGCFIVPEAIPIEGRVTVVHEGVVVPADEVRRQWLRFSWMAAQTVRARGWLADVLRCVRSLQRPEFRLAELYDFEAALAAAHPENHRVRDKIRQQLQFLRDRGILRFLGKGRYEVTE